MKICIVGNPENRRIAFFQKALKKLSYPPAQVISYLDLLEQKKSLEQMLPEIDVLRFESPGENWETNKAFLTLGSKVPSSLFTEEKENIQDTERVRSFSQWFAGYETFMRKCQTEIQKMPHLLCFSEPTDILKMFDKEATKKELQKNGIPTPDFFVAKNASDFYAQLETLRWKQVFVKPRYGSSASGIIAFYNPVGGKKRMVTSLERVRKENQLVFYNSLKLRQYTSERDLSDVLHFVLDDGAIVEKGISKDRQQGRNYDLRVVPIGGIAKHVVVRTSQSPLTNLHLGNRRGDWESLQQELGMQKVEEIENIAHRASLCFPKAFYSGMDVLIEKDSKKVFVLEVNAFGDLLPNIIWKGKNTYEEEIFSFLNQK